MPARTDTASVLQSVRKDIARCVKCGSCSTVCPSFLADRRESRSPRGRMALIEAVLDGRLSLSAVYRDRLATCTGCLACEDRCPSGVPVTTIIHAARQQAVEEQGAGLVAGVIAASLRNPVVMRSLAWLAPVALHYRGADVRARSALPLRGADMRGRSGSAQRKADTGTRGHGDAGKSPKGRIVFFPGCAVRYFQQDIEQATTAVLEHLGYEVIVPRGLECCGRPFLSLGDAAAARELAGTNTDLLASCDAEAIVTSCASCGLTFKREYPTLLAPSGRKAPQVLDIHEFLSGKLDLTGSAGSRITATVHDPCHLGRGQGLARTMRDVLRSAPGVTLVEMQEPARCCGFGGVMRATHPGASRSIGAAKARDITGTRADIVVTGCPGCRMQISDALRREGSPMPVLHTVQVLANAVRREASGVRGKDEEEPVAADFSLRGTE